MLKRWGADHGLGEFPNSGRATCGLDHVPWRTKGVLCVVDSTAELRPRRCRQCCSFPPGHLKVVRWGVMCCGGWGKRTIVVRAIWLVRQLVATY